MRKYLDIIKEYQSIPDTGWENLPDSTGSEPKGQIYIGNDEGIVKVLPFDDGLSGLDIWVSTRHQTPNVDIAFARLEQHGEYIVLTHGFVIPEYQGKGVMSELAHWIIRTQNMPIINDSQITNAGEQLFKSLMKKFNCSVVNIKTGDKHEIAAIDGVNIIAPEKDNAHPTMYDAATDTGQRFFYLLEAPEYFRHIREGVEHRYSCDDASLLLGRKRVIRYFSDGDV